MVPNLGSIDAFCALLKQPIVQAFNLREMTLLITGQFAPSNRYGNELIYALTCHKKANISALIRAVSKDMLSTIKKRCRISMQNNALHIRQLIYTAI